jgi:hypothetical protein
MLTYLGSKWPTEFAQAGGEIGMPVNAKSMGAYRAFAMWGDANVTLAQQRIILRHLRQFFGHRIAVPEAKIRELGAGVVNPKTATIKHNGKNLTYSYRDIDDLIGRFVTDQFRTRKGFAYERLDIVVGGDYGQGSFRSGIKLIFRRRDKNGKLAKEIAVLMIGTIECQKDSYDILKVTLAPKLNKAFKRMIKYSNPGTSKMTDGAITTFMPGSGSGEYYSTFEGERLRPTDVLLQNSPFRLFITGDLAFYAMMVGKEDGDRYWCHWCQLGKPEWQTWPYTSSSPACWTIEELVAKGQEYDEKKRVRGLKDPPLFDCVRIDRYIVPALHLQLGLGNRILKDFFLYVDVRLEEIPDELREARTSHLEAICEKEDIDVLATEFGNLNGPELARLRLQHALITDWLSQTGNSTDEQRELVKTKESLSLEISGLVKEKSVITADLSTAKKKVRVALKNLVNQEKKHGTVLNKTVRLLLEAKLKEGWNVERSRYHGGDLEGPAVRRLMEHSTDIFSAMETILLQAATEKGWSDVKKGQITERCRVTAEILHLFDGFFAEIRKDAEQSTEESRLKSERFIGEAMDRWRALGISVPPKGHAAEYEQILQNRVLKGVGDFMEDWVEQLHQFGKVNDVRTRNMRDKVEKYVNMARWEKMNINPGVVKVKQEVKEASKRKFRIERPEKKKRAKISRNEKRTLALETVVPVGEAGIMNGFQLNLEEHRSNRT